MIRAEILVRGSVQKVGYRDLVQEEALKLGVKGFVENLKDGRVRIVCEAEEEKVKQLIERINVKEELVYVENIDIVKKGPATGEFQYFEIRYGTLEEELGEKMVAAVKYAKAMWGDIREVKTDIKEVKTDIKEMKTDIKDMKDDIKEIKTDVKTILVKQDEVVEEVRGLREDLAT